MCGRMKGQVQTAKAPHLYTWQQALLEAPASLCKRCQELGHDQHRQQQQQQSPAMLSATVVCVCVLQILYYVAGSLLWVPNAVLILLLVFALGSPIADKAWACRDPTDSICSSLLENPDAAAVQAGFCAMQPSQWHWTGDPAAKLVSRFGLVCGDAWKAQVANSFFFVGYFIGSGLFGVLSDKYGRKVSAFGASLLAAVFTAAAAGASNYWGLLSFRLLTGG